MKVYKILDFDRIQTYLLETSCSQVSRNHPHSFKTCKKAGSRRYEVFICKQVFASCAKFCIEIVRHEDRSIAYFCGSRWFNTLEELEINLSMNFPDCAIEACNDPEECMLIVCKTVKGIKKEVLDNAFMNHVMLV